MPAGLCAAAFRSQCAFCARSVGQVGVSEAIAEIERPLRKRGLAPQLRSCHTSSDANCRTAAEYSSSGMEALQVPVSSLAKKVPNDKGSGDSAVGCMKGQQRLAFVEAVDMLSMHPDTCQAVRDCDHGLLAAASQQKEAIQEHQSSVTPSTMGRVDEGWIVGHLAKTTHDPLISFVDTPGLRPEVRTETSGLAHEQRLGLQAPSGVQVEPVLARAADARIAELGNHFAGLCAYGLDIAEHGKVNCGRASFVRAALDKNKAIRQSNHIYSGGVADIPAENITDDFCFEHNWNMIVVVFVKGSRKHFVLDFFRIDRCWVSLPTLFLLIRSARTMVLDLVAGSAPLSDHVPGALQWAHFPMQRLPRVPSWVARPARFAETLAEVAESTAGHGDGPVWERLRTHVAVMHIASKTLQKAVAESARRTGAGRVDRLDTSLAFSPRPGRPAAGHECCGLGLDAHSC